MSGAEEVFSIYRKRREEGREERMEKGRKKGCSKKSTHNSAASRAMSHFLLAGARSELGYEFLRIRGRHFCFGFSSFHTPSSGLLCIALKSLTPSSTAHAAAGECVETCKRKEKISNALTGEPTNTSKGNVKVCFLVLFAFRFFRKSFSFLIVVESVDMCELSLGCL